MSTVVDFPIAPAGYAARASVEPVPDVIASLEGLLERAKKGEIRGFAMATVGSAGVAASVWAGTDGWFHEISSGILTLQYRWMWENSGYRPIAQLDGA